MFIAPLPKHTPNKMAELASGVGPKAARKLLKSSIETSPLYGVLPYRHIP